MGIKTRWTRAPLCWILPLFEKPETLRGGWKWFEFLRFITYNLYIFVCNSSFEMKLRRNPCSRKKKKKENIPLRTRFVEKSEFEKWTGVIARTSPSEVERGGCKTDKDYPISIPSPASTDITVELNRWPPLQDAVQDPGHRLNNSYPWPNNNRRETVPPTSTPPLFERSCARVCERDSN